MSELALKLIAENKMTRSPFLDLGNCGLTHIPEELAELEWLEELSFATERSDFIEGKWHKKKTENHESDNLISSLNTKGAVFSQLTHLKKLFLNGGYNYEFEFSDLSPLVNLCALQHLDISRTQVSKLHTLAQLKSLQQLNVSRTKVRDLKLLDSSRTTFSNLSPLGTLKSLQVLDISCNNISNLCPLLPLSSLQQLCINNTQINNLDSLALLGTLKHVNVSETSVSDLNPLAQLSDLQQLYVHTTQVCDLSPLVQLTSLKQLNVFNTQVSNLSPLAKLSTLQHLDVSKTNVSDLRPLVLLSTLKQLNVSETSVSNLNPLSQICSLQQLYVYTTQVSDLGPLKQLTSLKQLNVFNTQVSDLSSLAQLRALQLLDVSNTKVSNLSPLAQLSALKLLRIDNTQVSDLNPIAQASDLQLLRAFNTQISDLYPLLKLIKAGLKVKWSKGLLAGNARNGIYVENCPLTNPPAEIIQQGNAAILNYFNEQQAQGVDHLYEAKLLLIGDGGVGKTSLMRRLYQTDKPLPNEKDSTKGIDIHPHIFKLQSNRDFRLNVWDFGGQEIYHATHQFFLTKRSLYVLLDDTRNNNKSVHDHGFKYWLEVVDLLGEHSPVLIFQNEKSGRSKRIDQRGIKGKFTNVKEVYKGNLQTIDAANKIREAIEYFVQQLPHIGEALPALWIAIRADIEALSKQRPYISLQHYFDIYSQHLQFDRDKALHLSSYLHDLGVFLHFQDDALLTRTVILQNKWATEAVFKILDDEIVKANLGHFDTNDCQRLWQNTEYADMHLELLTLMQKFELCYQLPDQPDSNWLAPQLLSPSKPSKLADWAKPGDLVLRYRYQFLPKGMISRLIVRMHRFVQQTKSCWSTGVLFEHQDAKLLAELSETGSEIVLRARGIDAKALLSAIAADLDALNATFHGLSEIVEKLVPCHCKRCEKKTDPEFFEYKRLLQRKKDGKRTIECPASYEEVHVLALLDGISTTQLPEWAVDQDTLQKTMDLPESNQRTIKIFLASSAELKDERDQFDLYFRQQNDELRKQGLYLKIIRWENFLDAMSESRLQDEYNKEVR